MPLFDFVLCFRFKINSKFKALCLGEQANKIEWIIGQKFQRMRKDVVYIKFTLETCAANLKLCLVYYRAEIASHYLNSLRFQFTSNLPTQIFRNLGRRPGFLSLGLMKIDNLSIISIQFRQNTVFNDILIKFEKAEVCFKNIRFLSYFQKTLMTS